MKLKTILVLAVFTVPGFAEEDPANTTIRELLRNPEKLEGATVRVKGRVNEWTQIAGPEGIHTWVTLSDKAEQIRVYHSGKIYFKTGKEVVFVIGKFSTQVKTKNGAERNVLDASPGKGKFERTKPKG